MKARKALIFPLALLSAALLLPTPGSAQFEVGQRSVDECPCERRHPPVEEDVCVVEAGNGRVSRRSSSYVTLKRSSSEVASMDS